MNKEENPTPKISIIIPTLNESNNLPLLLSDLAEINDSEIIIVDSTSKDKTDQIAILYGAKFFKLNKKNRGLQLNFGAKKARSKWLLFLHADSRLRINWSNKIKFIIKKNYSDLIYFFDLKINNKKFKYRIIEFMVFLRCLFYKSPYGDQGLLINKENYFRNNGYKEIPIMEDFDFITRIQNKNLLIPLKIAIYTSSRKWERRNIIIQSFENWLFRKRWSRGNSLDQIYKDYYKKRY